MRKKMKISELFENEPAQWGLRGDPCLWRELKLKLANVEIPTNPKELQKLLENEFEIAVKYPITYTEFIRVERFMHGGMSSGGISPEFWRKKAIPLLLSHHPSHNNASKRTESTRSA